MSVAHWAAVVAAISTAALANPNQQDGLGHKAREHFQSPWRDSAIGNEDVHIRAKAEPHPVRFDAGLRPSFKIATGEFSKPGGAVPKIPDEAEPKGHPQPNAIASLGNSLETLSDDYDTWELRPTTMKSGAGLEYHITFGAAQRD